METTSVTSESESFVAESLWRDPISKRGRKAVVEGLDVDYLPKRFGLQNVSAFSAHNTDNVFALSNTTGDRNKLTLLRVADSTKASHDSDEDEESGSEYTIVGQTTQDYLGSAACWLNDTLLVSSTNGSVYLYNVKPSQDYGKKDFGSKVTEYKLNKPKFTQNTVNKSPIRVNRVCINPVQPNMFITLQNQLVTIWDVQNINDPVAVKRVSKTFPLAIDWNHTGNKFAIGGMGKTIKLFDTRMFATVEQNPVVWEQTDAHKDEIRDIKFNPFIPYWLATAGADSVIKLWDLRFTKSHLTSLEDHTNAVNRIDWSPSHVDILCSGSSDRSFKLWSLGVKPHNVIATHSTGMELAVIGVSFSKTTPTKSFCVSEGGNFRSVDMTDTFMESLMRSRYNDNDVKERNVEKEIYFRRFDKGFESARELAESLSNENKVDRAIEILDICYERNPPDPDIDVRDSGDPLLLFENELSVYSYFIPPNYPTHLAKPADPSTVAKIALLKTNLEIQVYVKNQEVHEVLDREREIYELLNKDITSVSVTTLCSVIQLVKQHDYIKCLEITEALAEIFSSFSHWSDLLPVLRLVVVPTIFDSEESPTKLVNCLLDHELIVEQLSFMKKFNDLMQTIHDNANASIIEFFEDHRPKLVLSLDINQMYFKALLATNSFDKFYNEINELMKVVEGFPFLNKLHELKESAFPLLKAFVLEPQRAEDDSLLHMNELSAVITCILAILKNCKPLPEEIEEFLTPNLGQLAIDVEGAFYGLQKLPNGKSISQQTAKDMISLLEKYSNKDFAWKTQVNTLKSLFTRYLE